MKIKKTLLSCLLMMGMLSASAQEQQAKTEYIFNPHWYVQLQAGGQYTLGEISFDKLLSPNAQVALGYQFGPVIGARLAVNAWQSKAGWNVNDNDYYKWKWNYVAPMVDVTFNLSNLFCGYNPNRLFNVSVFAGAGANIAWSNNEAADVNAALNGVYAAYTAADPNHQNMRYLWDGTKVRFTGQAGANFDFRVSEAVTLGLELQANCLNDRYNSKRAGNADWYFNALAGVKINLGKTHTTRTVTPPAPVERVVERVVEKIVEKPVPTPVPVEEKRETLRRDIFFTINSITIPVAERQKVQDIVDYMNKYPDAKVQITGYADKGTGNARINSRLSANRAQTVVSALIKKGISSSRIISDSKGDTVQPFAANAKNRVSICIAE